MEEHFIRPVHRSMLLVDGCAAALLDRIGDYEPPLVGNWITPATA